MLRRAGRLGTLLGLGVRSLPEYDGSSKQELELIPVVRYYGRTLFARTTQGTLEGGARWEIARGLHAGVQLAYVGGNDRTDVDPGAALGVHLEWDTAVGPAPVNVLLRAGKHLDSDLGAQTDLRGTVGVYGSHGLLVGLFAQATWATDDWVRSYYTAGDGGLLYTAYGVEGDLRPQPPLGSARQHPPSPAARRRRVEPDHRRKDELLPERGSAYRFLVPPPLAASLDARSPAVETRIQHFR